MYTDTLIEDIPQTEIYQNTKKAYNYQSNSVAAVTE